MTDLGNIARREDLPILLNMLGLNGLGAEIGVKCGVFSEILLEYSNLKILFSIDPWIEFDKDEYIDIANVSQIEHDANYAQTVSRLLKFKESTIFRATSEDAANVFKDNILDFVYIDANHSYRFCKKDLELWWPKMKTGGIFAGHDYVDGHLPPHGLFGVKRAIDEFTEENGLQLYLTKEDWPSWYIMS